MNKTTVILLVVLILAAVGALLSLSLNKNPASAGSASAYRKIDPEQAKTMMDDNPDAIILDVRTPGEFSSGHIPGAINIPVETIGGEMPELLPDLDATILVYCRSGNRSATASKTLVSMGYSLVYDFGGLNTWPYETVR